MAGRDGRTLCWNTWKLNVPAPNARMAREGSGKCLDKCQIFIENKQQQEKTNKQINKLTNKTPNEQTWETDRWTRRRRQTYFQEKEIKWRKERGNWPELRMFGHASVHRCQSSTWKPYRVQGVGEYCEYWLPLGCCIVRWVLQKLLTDVPRRRDELRTSGRTKIGATRIENREPKSCRSKVATRRDAMQLHSRALEKYLCMPGRCS